MKSRNIFLIMVTIMLIGAAIMLMGMVWGKDLGLTMFVLGIVVLLSPLTYPWLWVPKRVCVSCNKNKTRNRDENKVPICEDCEDAIWKEGLIKKTENEKVLACPVDGSAMHKLVLNGTEIVVDQCPTCKGTWLDQSEAEELEEEIGQPRSSGSFSSGLAIGMSMGRIG